MSKINKVLVIGSEPVERRGLFKAMPHKFAGVRIIVNRGISYNSPSSGGRELERGGIHPLLNPLPSRERNFVRTCVGYYKLRIVKL